MIENLFYTPNIDVAVGSEVLLSEEESNHCVRVLRLIQGDTVHLTNGKGTLCKAVVVKAAPKTCVLRIVERFDRWEARPYYLHIAVAPTKNIDRYEWMVEKVTEIGVDEVSPIVTARSERRVFKTDRAQRVAVSAMKQSLKAFLPVIHEPISFAAFINTPFDGLKLIAHCGTGTRKGLTEALGASPISVASLTPVASPIPAASLTPVASPIPVASPTPVASHTLSDALLDTSATTPSILRCLILIGPEGDFTPNEVAQAEANGFQSIHLGASRLRTETAGVTAAVGVYLFVCGEECLKSF